MKKVSYLTLVLSVAVLLLSGCAEETQEDPGAVESAHPDKAADVRESVYMNAAAYQTGFIAVGTGGRMDYISVSGDVQTIQTPVDCSLLDTAVYEDYAVTVGENGTILLLQEDGTASQLETDCSKDLQSICVFQRVWFIGGDDGTLLCSKDLEQWQAIEPPLIGSITGLAANDGRCIGVTDIGEIFVSTDGVLWDVMDYNEYYSQNVSFMGVERCDGTFYAYGVNADGESEMLMSLEGGVWSPRDLQVYQNGVPDENAVKISDICWDEQQIIAACLDGRAMTLPSCSECNTTQQVNETPLYSVAYNGGRLLFAGRDYSYQILDVESVRQYDIKPQAALEMQENGALIIDVRSFEEYDETHIAQSLHLELALVESQLGAFCPDKNREIIFYCSAGARSQKALETALELGYENVYNLGSIDDWCYDLEGRDIEP